MRKQIALLLCLTLLVSFAAGCAARPNEAPAPAPSPAAASEEPVDVEEPTVTEESAAIEEPVATEEPAAPEESPAPAEPTPEEDPAEPEEPEEAGSPYRFRPKVCSSYMTELFGEEMTETWFNLVDAVMAGEDTFACPDDFTYNWVMGQYPDKCFPVLRSLIDYCWERDHPVKDGVASFVYLVPREEAAAQIEQFAALVEEILNGTLEDDYSDFEKVVALYIYFSQHYSYDYEAARPEANPDYLCSYRVLTTGKGICQEFSVAYSYLLLQAGVDASTMSGHRLYDNASHQWSYVKINGHSFHVDPTYGVGNKEALAYVMMDDTQREAEDCYSRKDFILCSNYAQDHPQPDCHADDDSFREIWGGRFLRLDHENRLLYFSACDDEGRPVTLSFDYTGW